MNVAAGIHRFDRGSITTIILSSPSRAVMKDAKKGRVDLVLYMPLFELGEMIECQKGIARFAVSHMARMLFFYILRMLLLLAMPWMGICTLYICTALHRFFMSCTAQRSYRLSRAITMYCFKYCKTCKKMFVTILQPQTMARITHHHSAKSSSEGNHESRNEHSPPGSFIIRAGPVQIHWKISHEFQEHQEQAQGGFHYRSG